jgi:hypothetical protein
MIEVLQRYHLNARSILMRRVYRVVNPEDALYLKLDMSKGGPRGDHPANAKAGFSLMYFLSDLASFDIITVETREMHASMMDSVPFLRNGRDRLRYLPNGVNTQGFSPFLKPFSAKKSGPPRRKIGRPAKGL